MTVLALAAILFAALAVIEKFRRLALERELRRVKAQNVALATEILWSGPSVRAPWEGSD